MQLRQGAHGGAGIRGGGLLLDGDGGREAADLVVARLVHLADKLARVRGERLHVAPLAFRIDGVESQGRFSAAADTCDYHEFISWDANINIFQVMLACAINLNIFKSGKICQCWIEVHQTNCLVTFTSTHS